VADIDAFVQAEADALVAELSEWCAIPSVSSDPERAGDVRRSAEHLAGLMEAAGLDTEVLAVDGGQPAVYGEWLGAGAEAPTITVYGHHDVQPADPLEEWTTPPFEPTVRDGYLHARGASDDKGQIHFQVSAIRHLLAADGRLPVNVKFFVEGEEESTCTRGRSGARSPTPSPSWSPSCRGSRTTPAGSPFRAGTTTWST
jgi:acetylornithine deacetylase/succinyl-diaminopimelate desuccinylase-like protein